MKLAPDILLNSVRREMTESEAEDILLVSPISVFIYVVGSNLCELGLILAYSLRGSFHHDKKGMVAGRRRW